MVTVTAGAVRSGVVRANGTDIYHEIRGTGPVLVCISGGFGDAGYWAPVADRLADRFTVVTYDRRGNSRSPRPDDWAGTTVGEQADDAAALIDRLRLGRVAVLGSSAGATILLELVTRRPDVVRLALVHEPPLLSVLPNGAQVGADVQALVEQGFARAGWRGAAELFIRSNAGDETYEDLDAALRNRLLDNAATFFTAEVEAFATYRPDAEGLRTAGVRIVALAGVGNRGVYYSDAARWVADNADAPFVEVPGAHVPYLTCPDAFVHALRPLLETP